MASYTLRINANNGHHQHHQMANLLSNDYLSVNPYFERFSNAYPCDVTDKINFYNSGPPPPPPPPPAPSTSSSNNKLESTCGNFANNSDFFLPYFPAQQQQQPQQQQQQQWGYENSDKRFSVSRLLQMDGIEAAKSGIAKELSTVVVEGLNVNHLNRDDSETSSHTTDKSDGKYSTTSSYQSIRGSLPASEVNCNY